jgi:CheY-like chemotaxis protein
MILIVDDHQDTREMLAHILSWDKLESVAVDSGPAALDHLQANTVSLIILDYNMPQMDGLQVLRELKASERLRSIPVLIFSAFGDEIRDEVLKAGAAGHVQKGSLDWLLLGSQVHKFLPRDQ